ncbi:hypothetical protein LUZ60_007943 [Juncus effusus]|nr:hypothetical protein LUZ60_007943 [Juncus effusus]
MTMPSEVASIQFRGYKRFHLSNDHFVLVRRACWDEEKKQRFVDLLIENTTTHNGPKKLSKRKNWANIILGMKEIFPGSPLSLEQLKQLDRDMKKKYKSVKDISCRPGFTWDYENHTLQASDNKWQDLFTEDPNARKWQRKQFHYFEVLDRLYGDEYSQGASKNNGSALVQHNSPQANSSSVPADPTEEMNMNPLGMLPESSPILSSSAGDFLNLDDEGDPNSGNFVNNQLVDWSINSQKSDLPQFPDEGLRTDSQNLQYQHVNPNRVTADCEYSIGQCLAERRRLGSNQADAFIVGEIFKDKQNREIFLNCDDMEKKIWLSDCIAEARKEKATGNKRKFGKI